MFVFKILELSSCTIAITLMSTKPHMQDIFILQGAPKKTAVRLFDYSKVCSFLNIMYNYTELSFSVGISAGKYVFSTKMLISWQNWLKTNMSIKPKHKSWLN